MLLNLLLKRLITTVRCRRFLRKTYSCDNLIIDAFVHYLYLLYKSANFPNILIDKDHMRFISSTFFKVLRWEEIDCFNKEVKHQTCFIYIFNENKKGRMPKILLLKIHYENKFEKEEFDFFERLPAREKLLFQKNEIPLTEKEIQAVL